MRARLTTFALRLAASAGRAAGDRRGTTAIEYALIGALISTAIVGTVMATGVKVKDLFGATSTAFEQAVD